jgi:hypothetical protein
MKKRIIFTDQAIVDFCKVTRDTNEVHDPAFMGKLHKRVIVPGMFAFTSTVNLTSEFLKTRAGMIRVFFNTLLSSGDFADLIAIPEHGDPDRIRLSAVNHKDTLASQEEYTHIERGTGAFIPQTEGCVLSLPVSCDQVRTFASLTGCTDPEVKGFLFSVAYASHALFERIACAETEIEQEIDRLINGESKVSPFYHMLEIFLPDPFLPMKCDGVIDFRIHFEREKKNRNYIANLQCEQNGSIIYRSVYKLVGIPDAIILRMAKNKNKE